MGEEEPQPEMETVVITRAFKAAAAVMGFGCFLLAIVTTGATSWSTKNPGTPYHTYGLFETCEVKDTPDAEVDLIGQETMDCDPHPEAAGWRSACQALMILADLVIFASFVLLTVGICSAVAKLKFALYKVAIVGYLLVVVLYVIILIIYPTMALGADDGPDSLGWVYVVAWVNTALIFISALAVIIDKGEELTEREKVPDEEEGEGEEE